MLSAAKHPCSLSVDAECKRQLRRDPSPARKHGGLRMTDDSNFGIRVEGAKHSSAAGADSAIQSCALLLGFPIELSARRF